MKHLAKIAASALLVASSLMIGAPSAYAVTLQTDLAGRPIHADTSNPNGWCSGIAYGRVNGSMVLFTAAHCWDLAHVGSVVYASTGARLGTWGGNSTAGAWDLGWIKLDNGNWPTSTNGGGVSPWAVYRGDCSDGSCPGGSTSSYWKVDQYYGSADFGCANLGARIGNLTLEGWRTTQSSHTRYVTGTLINYGTVDGIPCSMLVSIYTHCAANGQGGYKDSGTALMAWTGEVIGIGHSSEIFCGGRLYYTNFREALLALDAVLPNGAFLCVYGAGDACN